MRGIKSSSIADVCNLGRGRLMQVFVNEHDDIQDLLNLRFLFYGGQRLFIRAHENNRRPTARHTQPPTHIDNITTTHTNTKKEEHNTHNINHDDTHNHNHDNIDNDTKNNMDNKNNNNECKNNMNMNIDDGYDMKCDNNNNDINVNET